MEIYQDLSKFETLDELQNQLTDADYIEKCKSFLMSKVSSLNSTRDTKFFLSSYCLVLFPEAYFTDLSQVHIVNSAADLIEHTSYETFHKYKKVFESWKANNLDFLIDEINTHLESIPESDDQRFSDGFVLQRSILNIANNFFNVLKNKTNSEQQNNPA